MQQLFLRTIAAAKSQKRPLCYCSAKQSGETSGGLRDKNDAIKIN